MLENLQGTKLCVGCQEHIRVIQMAPDKVAT